MSEAEATESRIEIEDLPQPTEELTAAEAKEVKGGANKGTTNTVLVYERY